MLSRRPNGATARKSRRSSVSTALAGLLVSAALALVGCGSDSAGGDPVCESGRTLACACPGTADGVQICKADGSGWSTCDCGQGGQGGSAASGGNAGAGGNNGGNGGTGNAGAGGSAAGGSGAGGSGAGGSGAGGSGGTSGSAGSATGGSAGTGNGCPTGRGSDMVRISHPMGDYCIDKTEATKGQYAQFRADMDGDYSGQPDYCSWNVDYSQASCGNYSPTDDLNHPAGCLDWCDADQFCRWSGKRLCGNLGGGGNLNPLDQGEWEISCSAAAPGGDCNAQNPATVSVDSGCAGTNPGFEDVFHLLGNVGEWVHECGTSLFGEELPTGGCSYFGGSFVNHPLDLACDAGGSESRDRGNRQVGVRCCATAGAQ